MMIAGLDVGTKHTGLVLLQVNMNAEGSNIQTIDMHAHLDQPTQEAFHILRHSGYMLGQPIAGLTAVWIEDYIVPLNSAGRHATIRIAGAFEEEVKFRIKRAGAKTRVGLVAPAKSMEAWPNAVLKTLDLDTTNDHTRDATRVALCAIREILPGSLGRYYIGHT